MRKKGVRPSASGAGNKGATLTLRDQEKVRTSNN
jgi:hypothetical protein